MNTDDDQQKHTIGDFLDDEAFYSYKKQKAALEKVSIGIYMYAGFTLFLFVIQLLLNNAAFDWIVVLLNILLIGIYFCLAYYSTHQPFTAFVAMIAVIVFVLMLQLFFTSQIEIKKLIFNTAAIVFLVTKLTVAKKVQDYKSTTKK